MDEKDILADSIVKAIAYAENGGKPDIDNPVAGKTGEMKSIFQFTPDTWKKDSVDYLGKEVPISPDAEAYVMKQKVKKLMDKGYTARQIASVHNAGAGEPDAYTGKFSTGNPSVGINKKYGVKFDVPSYADKVLKYSKQFYDEKTKNPSIPKEADSVISTIKNASTKQSETKGLEPILSLMKQATAKKSPNAPTGMTQTSVPQTPPQQI